MIILNVSNASELISSKVGKFIESISPDTLDNSLVEDLIVKKMIENLLEEGVKGDISVIKGVNLDDGKITIDEHFKVVDQTNF